MLNGNKAGVTDFKLVPIIVGLDCQGPNQNTMSTKIEGTEAQRLTVGNVDVPVG